MTEILEGAFQGHFWAEPSSQHLQLLMRNIVDNPDEAKKKGVKVWREAFLDRGYKENGQLQGREKPGAIVSDVNVMYSQLKSLINKSQISFHKELSDR